MPTEAYEVIIGVSAEQASDEQSAIAEASRYLAYADQSDTFGYGGRVFETAVYGDGSNTDWGVNLTFTVPIASDERREEFLDEMDTLAHVESVVEVGYQPIEEATL